MEVPHRHSLEYRRVGPVRLIGNENAYGDDERCQLDLDLVATLSGPSGLGHATYEHGTDAAEGGKM